MMGLRQILPLLKDSPVFPALMDYMGAGGIFMMVSGNDLNRTFKRLTEGLPQEMYSRVLLAANGGADLVCIVGRKTCIHYKLSSKSLDIATGSDKNTELDIVYIGDDASPDGNDRSAFEVVGQSRPYWCAV